MLGIINASLINRNLRSEPLLGVITMDVKENIELLVKVLGERMPFNQLLGLTTDSFDTENACIKLFWQDKLMGNPVHKNLHGGAIASILDVQGCWCYYIKPTAPLSKIAWDRVEPSTCVSTICFLERVAILLLQAAFCALATKWQLLGWSCTMMSSGSSPRVQEHTCLVDTAV